ncbi:hypothetical protein [Bartonella sp. DGB1]|uniref:hypothetical protein n=1 Tax=Bartonella sp. DGB1 TaxID=3239807 RepID=UPI003525BDB5
MMLDMEELKSLLSANIIMMANFVVIEGKEARCFWSGTDNIEIKIYGKSYKCQGVGDIFFNEDVPSDNLLGFKNYNLNIKTQDINLRRLFTSQAIKNEKLTAYIGFLNPATGLLYKDFTLSLTGIIIASQEEISSDNKSSISISLNSQAYQLSLAGIKKRSKADQLKRQQNDYSFSHTKTIGEKKLSWGGAGDKALRYRWDIFWNGEHWI